MSLISWDKIRLKTTFDIQNVSNSVFVDSCQLIPAPVYLIRLDQLDVRCNIMLVAEFDHFFCVGNSTDFRAGYHLSTHDNISLFKLLGYFDHT